jgi:2-keto-4-pentenoate hydratase/2-oxohepta-3-ene-1,7-dioic acid hydratase in catechol pathway
MRLARVRTPDASRWGIVDPAGATLQPVHGTIRDWGAALARAAVTGTGVDQVLELDGAPLAIDQVTLLAPLEDSGKVVGVGANYMAHLERLGRTERPDSTVAYFKPRTAIVDPGAEIAYPRLTKQLDYEVELVAVTGSERMADTHGTADLLGYTIGNDVSARDYAQSSIGGPDLFTMKALDRTAPVGPWITTIDEFGGAVQPDAEMMLRVNGEERQRDRTTNMIWSVDELLEYVVARTALTTGDLVFTGTTCGVGMEDGRFLEPGDVVEAEVDRIGILRNTVGPRP